MATKLDSKKLFLIVKQENGGELEVINDSNDILDAMAKVHDIQWNLPKRVNVEDENPNGFTYCTKKATVTVMIVVAKYDGGYINLYEECRDSQEEYEKYQNLFWQIPTSRLYFNK